MTKVILYADDTAILCKSKKIAQIQNMFKFLII